MSSSGNRLPWATIFSACCPTGVLGKYQQILDRGDGETYPSAICCRNRSPVDNERMSYFFTRRAESVPFPAPGFPNISIRRNLVSRSSPVWVPRRELKNGRALRAAAAVEKLHCLVMTAEHTTLFLRRACIVRDLGAIAQPAAG